MSDLDRISDRIPDGVLGCRRMARTAGRPQALRAAATRLTIIEAVLDTGSVREAAQAVGIHEKSVQRYAKANRWFDTILTAALARADRTELLASLEQWAEYEAGGLAEPPPLFVGTLPPGPPLPGPPDPVPDPKDAGALPTSYVPSPAAAGPEPADSPLPPVLVRGVELVGRTAAEFLHVDQDLVDDANKDLARAGLPGVEDIAAMIVAVVNDRTHPACAMAFRELVRIGVTPMQKAQARRLLSELKREPAKPVIDAEATEAVPPSTPVRRRGAMMVLEVPPNKARPHLSAVEAEAVEAGIGGAGRR